MPAAWGRTGPAGWVGCVGPESGRRRWLLIIQLVYPANNETGRHCPWVPTAALRETPLHREAWEAEGSGTRVWEHGPGPGPLCAGLPGSAVSDVTVGEGQFCVST